MSLDSGMKIELVQFYSETLDGAVACAIGGFEALG